MVWASFCAAGRGGIWFMPKNTTINGQVYLQVLKDKLPTHMEILNCTTFEQDGAPYHRTAAVSAWLQEEGIDLLGPWPGSSPDLNPIENMWVMMKQKIANENPTSEQALIDAIKRVWTREVNVDYCMKLASSMPDRIKAVLACHGRHTKY